MKAAWILAKSRWRERPGTLLLLSLAMAMSAAVPFGTDRAVRREVVQLRQQTQSIPLVAGSSDAGQTDLVLSALDYDPRNIPPTRWALVEAARQDAPEGVLPMHLGHRTSGLTLVGTESEVASTLGLTLTSGRWCVRPGEVVAGADTPTDAFSVGQVVDSEAPKKFALQAPPTQKLLVVGRCASTGSPADQVVWTNLTTAWVLDGLFHAHLNEDVKQSTEQRQVLSPNTPLARRLYEQDTSTLHAHTLESDLPIHLLRIVPKDQRSLTLVRSNLRHAHGATTAVPEFVADELAESFAARAKLIQLAVLIPGIGVSLLALLVIGLDWQRRRSEHAGLRRLGASQSMLVGSFALELLGTVLVGLMLLASMAFLLSLFAAQWVM
ncbi:MAG: hypothetical protein CMJ30_06495 [Phycisphaerae bacterium]|jgi:hypothetical protein|nr:hypothetical protein [Phycisphaerae bacterium]